MSKQCSGCDEWKAESEYHKDRYSDDGRFHRCKECTKEHELKRYWENPEHERKRKRIHYHNNIDAQRLRLRLKYHKNKKGETP